MRRRSQNILLMLFILVAVCGMCVRAAGGGEIKNLFWVGTHDVIIIQNYDMNRHWVPGETVTYEATLYNMGSTDAVVRIRTEDTWNALRGVQLSGIYTEAEQEYDVAEKLWTQWGITSEEVWQDGGDGYYYYTEVLKAGMCTPKLITGIKLTDEVICDSSGIPYAAAEYQLHMVVESLPAGTAVHEEVLSQVFGTGIELEMKEQGNVNWIFNR